MKSSIKFLLLLISIFAAKYALAESSPIEIREKIYNALVEQKYFDKVSRPMAHMVHICNLEVDNKIFGVIQIRKEIEKPDSRTILITDSSLQVVSEIAVTNQRPMLCSENRILWYGYFDLSEAKKDINVFSFYIFDDIGFTYLGGYEDPSDFPSFVKGHWGHQ